jgi:predicted methyltransferase
MRAPLSALLLIACVAAQSSTSVDYATAVAAPGRPADLVKFDATWKPGAVLEFLGLEPRMTVLDIIADGGYYSEIMARVVGPEGAVVALVYDEKASHDFAPLGARNPNLSFQALPMHSLRADSLAPDRFDFVLLNIMYHDVYWEDAKAGAPHIDPENVLAALYRAVKPGGIVGVIDFVGKPGDPRVIVNQLHRIDPARVRADFEGAGFVFEGQSDLLHVASDDHTLLVFDPAIRGKTDKFVSRFRKPRTRDPRITPRT